MGTKAKRREARQKRRKRARALHNRGMGVLLSRHRGSPLLPNGQPHEVRTRPEQKVSGAILAILGDELDNCPTTEEAEKEITLAVVAWNMAVLDTSEASARRSVAAVEKMMGDMSAADKRAILLHIAGLVARKHAMFPDWDEFVLDFEFTTSPTNRHLSVLTARRPPEET